MMLAFNKIRTNSDLKSLKTKPIMVIKSLPIFVGLPLVVYKAVNDNEPST